MKLTTLLIENMIAVLRNLQQDELHMLGVAIARDVKESITALEWLLDSIKEYESDVQ